MGEAGTKQDSASTGDDWKNSKQLAKHVHKGGDETEKLGWILESCRWGPEL